MKYTFCVIFMACMLVACGDKKLPQECNDVFDIFDDTHTKLETNPYVPAGSAAKYKQRIDSFSSNFKKGLLKNDYGKQVQVCKSISVMLKNQLDQLNNAKNEAEVKKILPSLI